MCQSMSQTKFDLPSLHRSQYPQSTVPQAEPVQTEAFDMFSQFHTSEPLFDASVMAVEHAAATVSDTASSGSDADTASLAQRPVAIKRVTASVPANDKKKKKGGSRRSSALTTKGFKRHFAKHDYHDYSQTTPEELASTTPPKPSRGGVHTPFPSVLHKVLEDASVNGYDDAVSWQPHGRAFLIHNHDKFVDEVLPMHFKHSKISSFQRQLSLYGFNRLTQSGPDRGAYYHECFLRGRPFLCVKIQRTRIKGTWIRKSSSPDSEPNFYAMPPVADGNVAGAPSKAPVSPLLPKPEESDAMMAEQYQSLLGLAAASRKQQQHSASAKVGVHATSIEYADEHRNHHVHHDQAVNNQPSLATQHPTSNGFVEPRRLCKQDIDECNIHSFHQYEPNQPETTSLAPAPLPPPPPVVSISVPRASNDGIRTVNDARQGSYMMSTSEPLALPNNEPATPDYGVNIPLPTPCNMMTSQPDASDSAQLALHDICEMATILSDVDLSQDCFGFEQAFAV